MKTYSWFICSLLTTTWVCTVQAQSTSSTPPVGYTKIAIRAEADNPISLPLKRDAITVVKVNSATANSIQVAGSPWTIDQFLYDPDNQKELYFVEFISGSLQGLTYKVMTNTENTLYIEANGEDLLTNHRGSLKVGDIIAVRPFWKVGQLFGSSDTEILLQPQTTVLSADVPLSGDAILIPDNQNVGVDKRPLTSLFYVAGLGWRSPGDPGNSKNDYPFATGSSMVVHRQFNQDTELVLVGNAELHQTVSLVKGGNGNSFNDVLVPWNFPEPVKLDNSGLHDTDSTKTVLKSSLTLDDRADELLIYSDSLKGFDRPPERSIIFVEGQGWVELGSNRTTVGQDTLLQPGKAYLIRKKPDSPNSDWVQTPNF